LRTGRHEDREQHDQRRDNGVAERLANHGTTPGPQVEETRNPLRGPRGGRGLKLASGRSIRYQSIRSARVETRPICLSSTSWRPALFGALGMTVNKATIKLPLRNCHRRCPGPLGPVRPWPCSW
jgi:hypothetical protein